MRCKSHRVFLYLLIGIVFGILISSSLQILTSFPLSSPDKRRQQEHQRQRSVRIALSPEVPQEAVESFHPQNHDQVLEEEIELRKDEVDTPPESTKVQKPKSLERGKDYSEDEKLEINDVMLDNYLIQEEISKKQIYMEQSRQGRNMQDLHVYEPSANDPPVAKLSDELALRKPLLIAVITSVQQLMSQTIAIHGTWAKEEPSVLYFVGDVRSLPHLPHGMTVIELEGVDDKQATWEIKEMAVFKYIVSHYSEQVDWYLILGDDAYVKPDAIKKKLDEFNPNVIAYIGNRKTDKMDCDPTTGIVYSRSLVSRVEQYLPQCLGERQTVGECIIQRGIHCTRAQETHDLFFKDKNRLLETSLLYKSEKIIDRALTFYPIRYPKFMYRLYGYLQEIKYNSSTLDASEAVNEIIKTLPFIPTHLQSPYKPSSNKEQVQDYPSISKDTKSASSSSHNDNKNSAGSGTIKIRPRYMPKNKFEMNAWDYFNQTRLMSLHSDQPSHGIIGGIREEARFMLTKGISIANQGLPLNERLIFEKLENGYHRVDPMRGSEYVLDFVFKKSNDRSKRVRKRITVLRPYHEAIVPIDTSQHQSCLNFIVTLSGLSERLELFLQTYEKNVLVPKEDASLTIALYDGPDSVKVESLIKKYASMYPEANLNIVKVEGSFARGVGLDRATERFKDDDLLFLVDIDLEIGADFLRRAKLNVVQGKQVYFPIFFKLYKLDFVHRYHKGNSTQLLSRHNGHWAHYSYGMVVIYASDYRKVGGFDTSIKGWGEEDVDLFKRVISHGLEVFRAPEPGLVHLWHPKACNKDTVATEQAYQHCIQSKSENLADRVELAQYVFQKELETGNIL